MNRLIQNRRFQVVLVIKSVSVLCTFLIVFIHVNHKKIFADQSDIALSMFHRAVAFGEDGKFVEARELLRKALADSPGHPAIITILSVAEDGAAERIPTNIGKSLFASTAAGWRGDWDASLSLAQKATKDAPNYAPAHLCLGVVYAQLLFLGKGDHYAQDAIVAYKKAIHIKPNYAQAHFNLGVAYAGTQQWRIARAQLEHARELAQAQNDNVLLDHCDRMLSKIADLN